MSVTGVKMESQRKEYGRALVEMGSSNRDIVVLDADLSVSTRTGEFGKVFPDRFFNCGVSEANMICVAAGLAMAGKTAFASTFAVFATGLTYNQIRQSVAYPASNVKIAASHAGLSVGPDGATHQMLEDIGLMRGLPNMTVIVPADAKETYQATYALAEMKGPAYMRFGRADVPSVSDVNGDFRIGKASVLKNGSDVTIVATGQLVHSAIQAAAELSDRGVDAEVINMSTIKPIDTGTLIASARRTGCIVTAEEHSVINGLGDAVCSVLSESYPVPVAKVGTEDTFGESGEAGELLVKYGLTPGRIVDRALKLVAGRK
ncbi:MAG: transketolase family protein [Thermoplasmata archaeon YP2-bin.285]|uniref:Transketolase family protein n=1 Tax=Candidatus Sysuiplasma superficiale TaxID=2823368 RepID=A0A8J7YQE6_9ARCH|nr:transketolase family protein [Candidatus Sysuiplasma superficiale]